MQCFYPEDGRAADGLASERGAHFPSCSCIQHQVHLFLLTPDLISSLVALFRARLLHEFIVTQPGFPSRRAVWSTTNDGATKEMDVEALELEDFIDRVDIMYSFNHVYSYQ